MRTRFSSAVRVKADHAVADSASVSDVPAIIDSGGTLDSVAVGWLSRNPRWSPVNCRNLGVADFQDYPCDAAGRKRFASAWAGLLESAASIWSASCEVHDASSLNAASADDRMLRSEGVFIRADRDRWIAVEDRFKTELVEIFGDREAELVFSRLAPALAIGTGSFGRHPVAVRVATLSSREYSTPPLAGGPDLLVEHCFVIAAGMCAVTEFPQFPNESLKQDFMDDLGKVPAATTEWLTEVPKPLERIIGFATASRP